MQENSAWICLAMEEICMAFLHYSVKEWFLQTGGGGTPLILALGYSGNRDGQISEFKPSLVYKASSRTARVSTLSGKTKPSPPYSPPKERTGLPAVTGSLRMHSCI